MEAQVQEVVEATPQAVAAGLAAIARTLEGEPPPELITALKMCEDPKKRAVEWQRVLGRQVYAYESVFLGVDGLRGERIGPVRKRFVEAGLRVPNEPDALASQLLLMSWLLDQGRTHEAAAFWSEHLGQWWPVVSVALEQQGDPWSMLVEWLDELLPARVPDPPRAPTLNLDNPKTGIKRIINHLLVPVRSGWYLSFDTIQRTSMTLGLPCGFSSRFKMLESLVFTAVDHDDVPLLIRVMQEHASDWEARYQSRGADGWVTRVRDTRRVLERMEEAVAS